MIFCLAPTTESYNSNYMSTPNYVFITNRPIIDQQLMPPMPYNLLYQEKDVLFCSLYYVTLIGLAINFDTVSGGCSIQNCWD